MHIKKQCIWCHISWRIPLSTLFSTVFYKFESTASHLSLPWRRKDSMPQASVFWNIDVWVAGQRAVTPPQWVCLGTGTQGQHKHSMLWYSVLINWWRGLWCRSRCVCLCVCVCVGQECSKEVNNWHFLAVTHRIKGQTEVVNIHSSFCTDVHDHIQQVQSRRVDVSLKALQKKHSRNVTAEESSVRGK